MLSSVLDFILGSRWTVFDLVFLDRGEVWDRGVLGLRVYFLVLVGFLRILGSGVCGVKL